MIMSQNAPQRFYLMQVGSMPEYQIPIVCYLVQTGDGQNILIDSGLPEIIPEGESEFENGQDVIEQLSSLGLKPDDIDIVISTHYDSDHAGRHGAFTKARYVVQRGHHLDAVSNPRFAAIRPQWDQPMERRTLSRSWRTILIPSFRRIMISTMPEDTRHSTKRTMLFSVRIIWMRRPTHVLLPFAPMGSANGAHSAGGRGHGTAAGAGAD
jgi:ribonuclease BN (tRNA processing enzyme)